MITLWIVRTCIGGEEGDPTAGQAASRESALNWPRACLWLTQRLRSCHETRGSAATVWFVRRDGAPTTPPRGGGERQMTPLRV
eukprot:scaffold10856_cov100-Isochrysis_galbana.AAC.3